MTVAMINFNQVKGGPQLLTAVENKLSKDAVISESSETPVDDKVLSEKAVEAKIVELKDGMTEHVEETVEIEEPTTEIKLAKTPTSEPVKVVVNGITYAEGDGVTVNRAAKTVTWNGEFDLNTSTVDKLQLLYVTGDKGPVVRTNIMGMVLVADGNRVGTWARVDRDFNTVEFNPNHGTWAGIKQVTNDYGEFTEIPVTYVRTETLTDGPYAGCNCWWISDHAEELFHVHPAFIGSDGQPHNLQVASYMTSKDASNQPTSVDKGTSYFGYWNNISYNDVHGMSMPTGMRPYSIYDHHFLARMMLVEFGTPDVQAQTVDGVAWTGDYQITYHGIHDPFGCVNGSCLLDGLTTLNGTYQVFAPDGSRTMVETGVSCPNTYVWPVNCRVDQVNEIDFGDMFIANTVNRTENSGSFADYQYLYSSNAFRAYWYASSDSGAFYLGGIPRAHSNDSIGFRVVRCV